MRLRTRPPLLTYVPREGTPGRDNPQHAPRGTRGKRGAQGETQEPAPAPIPQASRAGRAHTTRALHPPRQ